MHTKKKIKNEKKSLISFLVYIQNMYKMCLLSSICMFVFQCSLVFSIEFEFFSNNSSLLSGIPIVGTQI